MTLQQQLTQDMKTAMKAKDMPTLHTIRFLLSEIKNVEIDQGELDSAGIQKIVASQIKKIKEAIEEFVKANRQDLVASEKHKLSVLKKYLPQQLNDQELQKIVQEVVVSSTVKQAGPIIGQVMKKVAGRADGGRVAGLVKELLSE